MQHRHCDRCTLAAAPDLAAPIPRRAPQVDRRSQQWNALALHGPPPGRWDSPIGAWQITPQSAGVMLVQSVIAERCRPRRYRSAAPPVEAHPIGHAANRCCREAGLNRL